MSKAPKKQNWIVEVKLKSKTLRHFKVDPVWKVNAPRLKKQKNSFCIIHPNYRSNKKVCTIIHQVAKVIMKTKSYI